MHAQPAVLSRHRRRPSLCPPPRSPAGRPAPCCAGPTIYADYITEYSTDRIEMHDDAIKRGQRVLLVDDLVATGGTLSAQRSTSPTLHLHMPSGRRYHCRLAPLCAMPGCGMRRCTHASLATSPPCLPAAEAGVELVNKAGGEVVEAACVIELPELKGRENLVGLDLYVLVEKEGL